MAKTPLQQLLSTVSESVATGVYDRRKLQFIHLLLKDGKLIAQACNGYMAISGSIAYDGDIDIDVWISKDIARLSLFFPRFSLEKMVEMLGAEQVDGPLDITGVIETQKNSDLLPNNSFGISPALFSKLTSGIRTAKVETHASSLVLSFTQDSAQYEAVLLYKRIA